MLLAFIIGITSWPWTARSIRSQTLSLKAREFIDLPRISGLSELEIVIQDVLPNMLSYVFMCFALQMANGILSETGLSMIGSGPTDIISLGMILRWALLWETVRRYSGRTSGPQESPIWLQISSKTQFCHDKM